MEEIWQVGPDFKFHFFDLIFPSIEQESKGYSPTRLPPSTPPTPSSIHHPQLNEPRKNQMQTEIHKAREHFPTLFPTLNTPEITKTYRSLTHH